jgi:hypothetical protein
MGALKDCYLYLVEVILTTAFFPGWSKAAAAAIFWIRSLGDEGASADMAIHPALALQPLHGAPHQAPRCLEMLCEIALGWQAIARLETAPFQSRREDGDR